MAGVGDTFETFLGLVQAHMSKSTLVFLSSTLSPDEKYLIAGANSGHIFVWDLDPILVCCAESVSDKARTT
jgi:hypothetical protein